MSVQRDQFARNIQHPKHQKEKVDVSVETQEVEKYSNLAAFFRAKGLNLKKRYGDDSNKPYPQEIISERLGISVDSYKKVLYDKARQKRDMIIAISAAHGLNAKKTSEALVLCGLPSLDIELEREDVISKYLDEHEGSPSSVEELSDCLKSSNHEELNISVRKTSKGNKVETETQVEMPKVAIHSPYEEITKRRIETIIRDIDYQFCDLKNEYLPHTECIASVVVKMKNSHHHKYLLQASSSGLYGIQEDNMLLPEEFDDKSVPDIFKPILAELMQMAKNQKQKKDDILNDSRNYKGRFSADIIEDQIHIFYEEYNYDMPYRNEYFMMEYRNKHFVLSVSHRSMFMQEYLSAEEYYKHYHTYEKIPRGEVYSSEEEIDKAFETQKRSVIISAVPSIHDNRKMAYARIKELIKSKLKALQEHCLHIRDPYWLEFDDDPWALVLYMKAGKYFESELDEYGEPYLSSKTATIELEGGDKLEISWEDMEKAFDLGLTDINDICRIKQKYGDLEGVLYT